MSCSGEVGFDEMQFATRLRIYTFIAIFVLSSTKGSELHDAVRSNNLNLTSILISQGYDVNEYDEIQGYPLESAIGTSGSIDMAILLLQNGANANTLTLSKTNYEHILRLTDSFSFSQTLSKIILLLSYGANPKIENELEINHAYFASNYLHLIIYSIWNYDDNHSKPKNIKELNEKILKLPLLRIQCLLTLCNSGLPLSKFWPSEVTYLKQSGLY